MDRLTQTRPTAPYRADCGHLCNCFPLDHFNGKTTEHWYEHDIFPTYTNDVETGTECGPCYRSRMDKATAHMTLDDATRAFQMR